MSQINAEFDTCRKLEWLARAIMLEGDSSQDLDPRAFAQFLCQWIEYRKSAAICKKMADNLENWIPVSESKPVIPHRPTAKLFFDGLANLLRHVGCQHANSDSLYSSYNEQFIKTVSPY